VRATHIALANTGVSIEEGACVRRGRVWGKASMTVFLPHGERIGGTNHDGGKCVECNDEFDVFGREASTMK
jgi:hypothetical protein